MDIKKELDKVEKALPKNKEEVAAKLKDAKGEIDKMLDKTDLDEKAVAKAKDLKKKPEAPAAAPTTKECPYCLSEVPIKATRCPHCTSELKE